MMRKAGTALAYTIAMVWNIAMVLIWGTILVCLTWGFIQFVFSL